MSAARERLSKPLAWGNAYAGEGDAEHAAQVIRGVLAGAGMACRRREAAPGSVAIDAEQSAAWYRILAGARPQRAAWIVERQGDRLVIGADFRLFRWYAALVGVLWLASGACFLAAGSLPRGPSAAARGGALLLTAIVLIPIVINLLGALGTKAEPLWHQVLHQLEQAGGRFEPLGKGLMVRHTSWLVAYFVTVLALACWYLRLGFGGAALRLPSGMAGFLVTLGGLVVLLLISLGLIMARSGFNLRTYGILTGMMSMTSALLLFQVPLLPWWAASRLDLALVGPSNRVFGRLALAVSLVLFAAVSYLFLRFGIYSSPLLRPQLVRLQKHRGGGPYRLAIGGASPLPFQILFVITWAGLAALVLASLAFLFACAVQAVHPFSDRPELRLPAISTTLIAAALGRPAGNGAIALAVRVAWVACAAVELSLLSLSCLQLAKARCTKRRSLARGARRPFSERAELERWLDEACRRAGLGTVRLALREPPGEKEGGVGATAEAHRFGLLWPERYVEINTALLLLPHDQQVAVIGHECAHHLLGHLALGNCLRWLGRLSFAGDGFTRAVQDSFGHEREADCAAVRELGAPREGLLDFLSARRAEAHADPPMSSVTISGRERWSAAFRLFLSQYRGAFFTAYYWHPDAGERAEVLRRCR